MDIKCCNLQLIVNLLETIVLDQWKNNNNK